MTFFVFLSVNVYFLMAPDRLFVDAINPLICTFKFLCGFVIIKHLAWFKTKTAFVIFGSITALLIFVKLPFLSPVLSNELAGITLFCVFLFIGQPIMKHPTLRRIISYLGSLTFPIFLLHHRIISYSFKFYSPSNWTTALLFLAVILFLTIACAGIVNVIIKKILKSKPFRTIENHILK